MGILASYAIDVHVYKYVIFDVLTEFHAVGTGQQLIDRYFNFLKWYIIMRS